MTAANIPMAYGTLVDMDPSAPMVPIAPNSWADSGMKKSVPASDAHTIEQCYASPAAANSQVSLPQNLSHQDSFSEEAFRALEGQGYTRGLAESLMRNKQAFPLRMWVVDNSGSMAARDGHRILESAGKDRLMFSNCTRWAEMQQTVSYHTQLAALMRSQTVFRLLNDPGRVIGPQQFSIAERGPAFLDEELAIAHSTMINASPGGVTPLTQHIREIRQNITSLAPSLRRDGTKVVIVLATDGLPSDSFGNSSHYVRQEFVHSLRSLEGLPVWIVVRLCTDEDDVVEFWNNLDNNLELSLEVLDDFMAEAKEVHSFNAWLNYGLPLHRMREMGFYHRVFDILDERKLSRDELRDFCRILFGDAAMLEAPDPEVDWESFLAHVERLVSKEKGQWNPITKRMEPWINIRQLDWQYGRRSWNPFCFMPFCL